MPQFNPFQTKITAYELKLGYQIKEKKILRNYLFWGSFENFSFRKIMTNNLLQ